MYEVVGCRSCGNLWIREGDADTASCPRCSKRFTVDRLRVLARGETVEAAREARSALLANRSQHGDIVAGYGDLEQSSQSAGISDETYLDAFGIEVPEPTTAPQLNEKQTVLSLLDELPNPTRETVVAEAIKRDIEPEMVEQLLVQLHENGDITREGGEYRRL